MGKMPMPPRDRLKMLTQITHKLVILFAIGSLIASPACFRDQPNEKETSPPKQAVKPAHKDSSQAHTKKSDLALLNAVSEFRLACLGDYQRALSDHADAYLHRHV